MRRTKKKVYLEQLTIIANSGVGINMDHIKPLNKEMIPHIEKLIEKNKFYLYKNRLYVPNTYCVHKDNDNRVDNMAGPFLQCYMGYGEDTFLMEKTNQWVKDNYPEEYIAWEKNNKVELENLIALRKKVLEERHPLLKKLMLKLIH